MGDQIILVAESGADIPKEYVDKYNLHIVDMHVTFGNETRDDSTVSGEDVVDFYRRTGKLPKTSACNPADFEEAFDTLHAEYPDARLLYLAYSAVTTSSYQSAMVAIEDREYIKPFDTKLVSFGESFFVVTLAKAILKHPEWTIDDAYSAAEKLRSKFHMCFIPQNLTFLKAGGRVSNAGALIGNVLKIVPRINILDGYLVADKKYRGRFDKTIEKAFREMDEKYHYARDLLWIGMGPGFYEKYKDTVQKLAESMGFRKLVWCPTGAVITTHGGPGAFGIAGCEENSGFEL
ncbi:MAG: DegV family protein [Eubacterium sp.]|nr:DegV family protein [Eubacterium sp.]